MGFREATLYLALDDMKTSVLPCSYKWIHNCRNQTKYFIKERNFYWNNLHNVRSPGTLYGYLWSFSTLLFQTCLNGTSPEVIWPGVNLNWVGFSLSLFSFWKFSAWGDQVCNPLPRSWSVSVRMVEKKTYWMKFSCHVFETVAGIHMIYTCEWIQRSCSHWSWLELTH